MADVTSLLQIMSGDRGRRSATRARAAIETLWLSGREQQERIWTCIWVLANSTSWHAYTQGLPQAVVEFLLEPDPDSQHEPRVRLLRGMSIDDPSLSWHRDNAATKSLMLALNADDQRIRRGFADVLSRTDHPVLLKILQDAFVRGLRGDFRDRFCSPEQLWTRGGAAPGPLLRIVLANPHLPHVSPDGPGDTHSELVVLMALRGRIDLLPGLNGQVVVDALLENLTNNSLRPEVPKACRRALRSFHPGPLREAVCQRAMEPQNKEAVAAVLDADYLPTDLDALPLFLALTRQWKRLAEVDPDGQRLYVHRLSAAFTDRKRAKRTIEAYLWLTDGASALARQSSRQALHDLRPGPARDYLCALALEGRRPALRTVKGAGHFPSKPKMVPPFLFLTEQWDRYDTADPDGSRLRAYAEALAPTDSIRDRLRHVAKHSGRPAPCTPATRRTPDSRPNPYQPGGTGVAGTGGFSGTFTVHGV